MTLQDHIRNLYNLLADEVQASLEAEMVQAAAAGVARPVALAADFAPLARAVAAIRARTPVVSEMRSAEWAEVPVQIRNAAQFSAGVTSAHVMQSIQRRLQDDLQWKPDTPMGREAFIRDTREVLRAEGYNISENGALTDISSNRRLGLVYDMQTRQARNFAKWKVDQDPDLLAAAPAQELIRVRRSAVERPWARRWADAGGTMRGGRMAAHKLDPIWMRLSRFGNPWPPFDYNSGMGVEDVLAADAQRLGLEPTPPEGAVTERRFNEDVEAEVESLPADKIQMIRDRLGAQVELRDGKLRLSPLSWQTPAEADEWATRAFDGALGSAQYAESTMWAGRTLSMAGVTYRAVDLAAVDPSAAAAGYLKTNLSESAAWQGLSRDAARPALIKTLLPRGTQAAYLPGGDLVLPRGTRLEVLRERWLEVGGRRVREIVATPARGLPVRGRTQTGASGGSAI